MILIIDNTKNLNKAFMTPKIINILESMDTKYCIISSKTDLVNIINSNKLINGIILSGGPLCMSEQCFYNDISKNLIALNICEEIPILGICFGFQIMCDLYGGTISRLKNENSGRHQIVTNNSISLMEDMPKNSIVYYSHGDYVSRPPIDFKILKDKNMIIGIENIKKKRFGFQFHPEGSIDGSTIIKNFIKKYCY